MRATQTLSQFVCERMSNNPPGCPTRPLNSESDADPHCKKCGGFGWLQSKQYNGNWFVCACTVTMREKYLNAVKPKTELQIGLRDDELEMNWSLVKPGISDGVKAANAVRAAYERGWGMIFLWGTYGQAKTLVGKILTATAYRHGKRSAYANVSSVLDDIRLAFDEKEHKTTELLRRIDWWNQRDVLFLDELGRSNDTPWAQERMFQLLDQRYSRAIREEALTVIASNRSDDELDGYLSSRLQDNRLGPVLYLNGPDGRQVMPSGYKY